MSKQKDQNFYTTIEAAKLLGISRVAVFKKIKTGIIPAKRVGRNFLIAQKDITDFLPGTPSAFDRHQIDAAIQKTIQEYGETLKLLGRE